MSYQSIEESVCDAQRVEIFIFELPNQTFRLTSLDEDISFNGELYTAVPISRSQTPLVVLGKVRELVVSVALDHELAQILRANGIPPRDTLLTIRKFFIGDAESKLEWVGYVESCSTDTEFTRMRVPNRTDTAFDVQLPLVIAERNCQHVLYDRGCTVDAAGGGHIIVPTVVSVDDVTIVVSSIGGKPDGWAKDGKVLRVADNEERSVLDQVGTTLTINMPFATLEDGDALGIFAGCDHTIDLANGCVEKFGNGINFGGDPIMPAGGNPAAPTGLGVIVQV